MSRTVTVEELSRSLPDYLAEVTDRGEHVFVKQGDRVLAELRPVSQTVKLGDLGDFLASLPPLSEEEAEAFKRDVDEARAALDAQGWTEHP